MCPLKLSDICFVGCNELEGENTSSAQQSFLSEDMHVLIYHLYGSCFPFCSVSREVVHICSFWILLTKKEALLAAGHAALCLIVTTAGRWEIGSTRMMTAIWRELFTEQKRTKGGQTEIDFFMN